MKKAAILLISGLVSVSLTSPVFAGTDGSIENPAAGAGGGSIENPAVGAGGGISEGPAAEAGKGGPADQNQGGNSGGGPGGGDASSEIEDIEVSLADIPEGTSIVLAGASLLDKNHDMEVLDVRIIDGVIDEVGDNLGGDLTIDLSGYTLMPGMIDSHVHIAGSAGYNAELLKQFLVQGITSVREEGMLSTSDEEGFIDVIDEVNADPSYSYIVSCGKYLDVEGGYGMGPTGNMGIVISDSGEASAEIEHKAELGYSQVKIGINSDENRMTGEEITSIIDTAHQNGMTVAAHINYVEYLQELVGYGLDESAHTPDDEMPADLISQMAENGVAMNTSGCDDEEIKISNLGNFYNAGGFITVGTDKMRGYDSAMESLVSEMQIIAKAGLTVQQVIECTTYNNAVALDINAGLIESGYEADLIAVTGDVDETFDALLDVDFVMNDGAILLNDLADEVLSQIDQAEYEKSGLTTDTADMQDNGVNGAVITAEEAKAIMDSESDYIILDVREADEYAEGHIEGAVQLSYLELEEKAESVLKDKDQLILVYCRSGRRSAIAAETLIKLGYTNIKDFGGIINWPYDIVT